MSPASPVVAEEIEERQLSPEELHMYFGYSFQNPFPRGTGAPKIIGGVPYPFGTHSVEIQGRHYPIPASGVLTIRTGPLHRNPSPKELSDLAASGKEIVMLHPQPEIVVQEILARLSINAGTGKDAGVRIWDLARIAGATKKSIEVYLAGLTHDGKEALRDLIRDTTGRDITSEENLARAQNRVPNPPNSYQVRMLGVLKGLDEFLDTGGGDTAAQDAEEMAKQAARPTGDFATLAAMKYTDLLHTGKKMGLKLPFGIQKDDLIDMISKATVAGGAVPESTDDPESIPEPEDEA